MFPTEPTYVHCQHRVSPTWTLTLTLASAPTSADSLQARLQAETMQAARSNAAAEHAQATVAKLTRENATLRANVRASMAKAAETRLRQQAGAAARPSEAAGASVAASQKELTALRAHCQQLERESEKLKEAQTQLQEALARQVGQGERAAAAARQQVRRLQADARAQQLAWDTERDVWGRERAEQLRAREEWAGQRQESLRREAALERRVAALECEGSECMRELEGEIDGLLSKVDHLKLQHDAKVEELEQRLRDVQQVQHSLAASRASVECATPPSRREGTHALAWHVQHAEDGDAPGCKDIRLAARSDGAPVPAPHGRHASSAGAVMADSMQLPTSPGSLSVSALSPDALALSSDKRASHTLAKSVTHAGSPGASGGRSDRVAWLGTYR